MQIIRAVIMGVFAGIAATLITKAIMMRARHTRMGIEMDAWAQRAKGEILKKVADMEDLTEREFALIVDMITSKYGEIEDVSKDKIEEIADHFKHTWKHIKKAARHGKRAIEDMGDEEEEEREEE